MRIECPSCLELAEAILLRASESLATFGCAACKSEYSAEVAKPSANESMDERDATECAPCPKCGRGVLPTRRHCPGCGLDSEKSSEFLSSAASTDSILSERWIQLQREWHLDSAHECFVAQVALEGDFRLGARYYRQAAAQPARAARAERMLERIGSMATVALLSPKPKVEAGKEPYKGVLILLLVMLFLGAGVGVILMRDPPAPSRSDQGFVPKTISGQ